jgi:hypothetical protein
VTEIRAGIVVGPGSAAYEVVRDLVNHLPLMVTPRWVRSKSSPIALENLLEYLVRVASWTRPPARSRRGRARLHQLRGGDAPVRRSGRQAAPHPSRSVLTPELSLAGWV